MAINTQNSYTKIRYTIIGSSCEGCHPVGASEYYLKDWWSSQWNTDKTSSGGSNLTIVKNRCDYV